MSDAPEPTDGARVAPAWVLVGSFAGALALVLALFGFPGAGREAARPDAREAVDAGVSLARADRRVDLRPREEPVYDEARLVELGHALDRILGNWTGKVRHSIAVTDPATGQELYLRSAERALVPASNEKVLTGAAIYDRLGPDHRLETIFSARGAYRDGVIDGDLVVEGGGDPTVSSRYVDGDASEPERAMAAMDAVASRLHAAGLRRVDGDLIVWRSPFTGPRRGEKWPQDAYLFPWMVEVVALPFNDNRIIVDCSVATDRAESRLAPDVGFGTLRNRLDLTGSKGQHRIVVTRADDRSAFTVSGKLWSHGKGAQHEVNVADGGLYYLHALREALRRRGIPVKGEIRRARGDREEKVTEIWRRRVPVSRVVPPMLKLSQNLYAELLFRVLARGTGEEASFEGASRAMRAWLSDRGIDARGDAIMDGSGLSRGNAVSARLLVDVLAVMHRAPTGAAFREALAEPGEEGTLKKRMAGLRGRVFAKTGTLNGISSLSGYVRTEDGRWISFAVIFNGCDTGEARRKQDQICERLARLVAARAPAGAGR
ncbi:MAG: D-alanyl-D-alanine carboxypeptidase/D-alanyl-D-alanine-endopeptidase [Planctomycetota bacterium]